MGKTPFVSFSKKMAKLVSADAKPTVEVVYLVYVLILYWKTHIE